MDLEALIRHYFGTDDPDAADSDTVAAGKEKLAVDFGVEREPGRKFALWTLMAALEIAPPPAEAFAKHPELKRAAEDYLTATWRIERD